MNKTKKFLTISRVWQFSYKVGILFLASRKDLWRQDGKYFLGSMFHITRISGDVDTLPVKTETSETTKKY